LVLGPFQGPIACTRIDFGKGVCGAAWERKSVIVVPDVDNFPGHIACSSLSKSEIVVPVLKNDEVVMVLDVDSDRLDEFDSIDAAVLANMVRIIVRMLYPRNMSDLDEIYRTLRATFEAQRIGAEQNALTVSWIRVARAHVALSQAYFAFGF